MVSALVAVDGNARDLRLSPRISPGSRLFAERDPASGRYRPAAPRFPFFFRAFLARVAAPFAAADLRLATSSNAAFSFASRFAFRVAAALAAAALRLAACSSTARFSASRAAPSP